MTESILFKTPPAIVEKINRLCRLLFQEQSAFEQAAAHITDSALRCTVLTLAQNTHQYACELSSQVQTMRGIEAPGGIPISPYAAQQNTLVDDTSFSNENEVLAFCKMNEKKMVFAYRDILNESLLYEGLRKMIRYQLNGVLVTFMQLRLLNSLKFS